MISENVYETPIPFQGESFQSIQSSEEDFVDVEDLPSVSRWKSENDLLEVPRSERAFSTGAESQQIRRPDARRHTSPSNAVVNVRRSISSLSQHNNNFNRNLLLRVPNNSLSTSTSNCNLYPPFDTLFVTSPITLTRSPSSSSAYVVAVEEESAKIPSFKCSKSSTAKSLSSQKNKFSADNESKSMTRTKTNVSDSLLPSRINLRDSAIDLVSDENSEVYTAVSLAGTLQRMRKVKSVHDQGVASKHPNRKFYIIIAVLCGVILVLGGLGIGLALALFR